MFSTTIVASGPGAQQPDVVGHEVVVPVAAAGDGHARYECGVRRPRGCGAPPFEGGLSPVHVVWLSTAPWALVHLLIGGLQARRPPSC
ncbi:hypothetical protein [Pseudonocardia sp.]|uniref:hypothetical protein n=1 Tax=Pseudonocardia sp. TaxID=60912 RepID=UPI003D10E899